MDGTRFQTWVESSNVYHLIDGYELAQIYDATLMEAFLLSPPILDKIADQILSAYVEDESGGVSIPGRFNAPQYRFNSGPYALSTYNGDNVYDDQCTITGMEDSDGLAQQGYKNVEFLKGDDATQSASL